MPRPVTLTYKVYPTSIATAEAGALLFSETASQVSQARGRVRIAISGGSTPKTMFKILADPKYPYLTETPWDKIDLFFVDERTVPPTDSDSNYRMTRENLLDFVPLPPAQVHRIEGELDPEVAASKYESDLRNSFKLEGAETPTFDLLFLGMGDDGHTASLFPHTEGLNEISRLAIANHVPQKDTWRVTLTWPVINQSRDVAFLIEGSAKAKLLNEVFTGPYQPETYPSQIIRPASGKLTLLIDKAVAEYLPAPLPASDEKSPAIGTLELK
ncbi:6-phosphogluconolactonase [Granulicella sibirica]|uniref:6-phosphogluconolactonase n=1 Tax=Granulicella sibirica TaxID=2479048 RepID=A0A4Q0T2P8_9BACT|nr:6-phosphogluconolactonase [Granulicella sibirica]RXH57945.1 6-phosphogluconolactonase [Granulicella sibirica]